MRGRVLLLCLLAGAMLLGSPGYVLSQVDPRTALLQRAGREALAAGNASAAAQAFRDALTGDPNNAQLHLGAAMAAALERRDADAKAACVRALEIDPSLRQARLLLGQVLYRMKDLAGAIKTYETLTAGMADDSEGRDARATLDRWRRESALHDRMQQAIGNHFTVSFEGPAEAELAAQALDGLDRAYWRIGQVLSVYPSDPIAVVLYTAEQFRDITRSPAWAGGAFDGTIRVPMRGAGERPGDLDRVLAHEFTHALVRTLAPRGVPTWLNEGLATALEAGDLQWAERRVSGATAVPLQALRSGFGRFSGDQAQVAYATSALALRRLLDESGGVAVANLLRDLGDGTAFGAAFLRRIQRPFAAFQASPY